MSGETRFGQSFGRAAHASKSSAAVFRGGTRGPAVPSIRKSIDSGRAPASVAPVETKKASNGHSAKNRSARRRKTQQIAARRRRG